jgi:hypothetical protein
METDLNGVCYTAKGAADAYAGRDRAKIPIMSTDATSIAPVAHSPTIIDTNGSVEDAPMEEEPTDTRSMEFTSLQATIIDLVSTSATASAFPESFGLNVSSSGRWIIAFSSSALFILSTQHLPSHQNSCRAFRLRRKPVAASLTDSGRLAVLTTPHKIDIYQCGQGDGAPLSGTNQKLETIFLDNEAKTLAITENGELVAAGSDGGIEIRSLSQGALATDKRQINCGSLDAIEFSHDGKSILMSAAARRTRNSTFISVNGGFEAAMFEDEEPEEQPLGRVWISQLLFPEKLQCRQGIFIPEPGSGHVNELLAFDSHNDRFGVFDISMKQFIGKTLGLPQDFRFTRTERFDDCLPALSSDGSHAAIAVRLKSNHDIWAYHIPENWVEDDSGGQSPGGQSDGPRKLRPCLRSNLPPRDESSPSETLTCLRWVKASRKRSENGRLVGLISTAALSMPEDVVPSVAPAASGKILLFDFDREVIPPQNSPEHVTIDLDNIEPTEDLADEELELEQEVELVRRRTRVQRRPEAASPREPRPPRRSLSSSSATGGVTLRDVTEPAVNSRPRRRRSFSSMSSMSEDNNDNSPVAVDEPYSHSQPRTQFQLHRAATIAANSSAARTHLRALPDRPLEYRRADGLREIPHESDADNWVPPPPPYTERPDNTVSHPVSRFPGAVANIAPPTRRDARMSRPPTQIILPAPMPAPQPAIPQAMQQVQPRPRRIVNAPVTQPSPQVPRPAPPAPHPREAAAAPNMSPGRVQSHAVPEQAPPIPTTAITIPRRPVTTQRTATPETIPRPPRVRPLSPPEPGNLHSPMTYPPVAHPHRLSTSRLCDEAQRPMAPRGSVSTPASPVSNVRDPTELSQQQPPSTALDADTAAATADFAPARILPTPDQLDSLHRRSSSSDRQGVPRAARGAYGPGHARRVTSAELLRPLPPLPPGQNYSVPRHSSDSGQRPQMQERRIRRPALTRLATIASVVSQGSAPGSDAPADGMSPVSRLNSRNTGSANSPVSTSGRKQWWKLGGPSSSPTHAGLSGSNGRASQMSYSHSNTYNPHGTRPRTSPTDPPTPSRGSPRERGFRCVVM